MLNLDQLQSQHLLNIEPEPSDWFFCFKQQQIYLTSAGRIPSMQEFMDVIKTPLPLYGFASHQGQRCVLVDADVELPSDSTWQLYPAKRSDQQLATSWYQLVSYANHIKYWRQTHRYCGCCGHALQDKAKERVRECLHCGFVVYPRISPCVMVLVTRGDELLLARSPHFAPEIYSALAGFVEPGETLEHAAHREVREEVGIEIADLTYRFSQPWPFPDSLMMAFTATYQAGELQPDPKEIEAANWFNIKALPTLPSQQSVAYELISRYVNSH